MATVAGVEVDTRHFIGGKRVASDSTFADHSPIDGTFLADISRGGKREVDLAVAAAKAAFPIWSQMSPAERGAILNRVADIIESRIEDLAIVETTDNGSLLRSHRRGVMPRVAMNFRFFADYAMNQLSYPDFETRGHTNHVTWDPAGVTGIITPWNAPLMLATWRIGPALAAGDTVVAKPPEWAPLTASLLADITAEAGMPPGVFNVVQGFGEEAGAALTAHPDLSRISFTGSVPTAKLVAKAAAENLVPCSFELGGKSPLIITDDADLDIAVTVAVEQYDNAGQVCLSGTRFLVQRGIADKFKAAFIERAKQIKQGDPRDEATDIGPQIHPEHFARVKGFVDRAVAEGQTVVMGGGPNSELGGNFFMPTLIDNPTVGSEIVTQEVFGPVLAVLPFDNEVVAVRLANDSTYGLASAVWTGSLSRAHRMVRAIKAGVVHVNTYGGPDITMPLGGVRQSGNGHDKSMHALDKYLDLKSAWIQL